MHVDQTVDDKDPGGSEHTQFRPKGAVAFFFMMMCFYIILWAVFYLIMLNRQ